MGTWDLDLRCDEGTLEPLVFMHCWAMRLINQSGVSGL